jgi:hypothetical protein
MWAKSTSPQEGKTMEYKVISGDGHIDLRWLPHDLFVSHAPAQWKDQVPHVRDTPTGKHWFAEGRDLTTRPFGTLANTELPKRGESKHVDRMYELGFYDGQSHPTTPALRLKDQEVDGIDAEVMYGILGISRLLESRELLHVVYEIYNTWAAEFCQTNPARLVALACIPNDDPALAAAELRPLRQARPQRRRLCCLHSGEADLASRLGPPVGCGPGVQYPDLVPHHWLCRAPAHG